MTEGTVGQKGFNAQDYEDIARAIVEHAQRKLQSGALQPVKSGDGIDEFDVGPFTLRLRVETADGAPPSPEARMSGTCCVCVVDTGGVIVCRGWCCPGQPGGF